MKHVYLYLVPHVDIYFKAMVYTLSPLEVSRLQTEVNSQFECIHCI